MINPDGLPPCVQSTGVPCQGDGSTLEERLGALATVGKIEARGISSTLELTGDDTMICGGKQVRL